MFGKTTITVLAACIAAVQACDPPNGFMPNNPFTSPPPSSVFAYNKPVNLEWSVPYTGSTITLLAYHGCPQSQNGAPVNNDLCKGHTDLKGGLAEQNGTYTFTPTCDMLPQGGAKDTYGIFLINENPCWISWLMFTMSGNCDGSGATTAAGSSPSSATAAAAIAASSGGGAAASSVAASAPATTANVAAGGVSTTTMTVKQTMYVMTPPAGVLPSGMTAITAILEAPTQAAVAKRAMSGASGQWRVDGKMLLVTGGAVAWMLVALLV